MIRRRRMAAAAASALVLAVCGGQPAFAVDPTTATTPSAPAVDPAPAAPPGTTAAPAPAVPAKPAGGPVIDQPSILRAARHGRVIELTWNEVHLVQDGARLATIPRTPGPVTLTELGRLVAQPAWLSVGSGVATLSASLYVGQDVRLSLTGQDAATVQLVKSDDGFGGNVYGDGATVTFKDVTVTGWDASLRAAAPDGPQRPYVTFVMASTVTATNTTFSNLGRDLEGTRGLSLYDSAGLTLSGTTFRNNNRGLTAVRGKADLLDSVTLTTSTGAGAVIAGSSPKLSQVKAIGNGTDGLVLWATPGGTVSSSTMQGNGGTGLLVRACHDATVTDLTVAQNANAGMDLDGSVRVTLNGFSSNGGRYGLLIDAASDDFRASSIKASTAASAGVQLSGARFSLSDAEVTGSPNGLVVRAESRNSSFTGVTVRGATRNAIEIAGTGISGSGITVVGGANGLTVRTGASGVDLNGASVTDAATGMRVQESTGPVTVRNLRVDRATWGADVRSGGTTLSDSSITRAQEGVRMPAASRLENVSIEAADCGVRGEGGAPLAKGATIHAKRGTCGDAQLPGMQILPPIEPRPLGIFAGAMGLLAVAYEVTRRLRERRRSAATSGSGGKAEP